MTKPKLDLKGVDNIVSELDFFKPRPVSTTPPQTSIVSHSVLSKTASTPLSDVSATTQQDEANNSTTVRPYGSTPVRPLKNKRFLHRWAFEIYEDQLETLRQMKRDAEDNDEQLSISKIVRTALDNHFKKVRV